MGLIDRIFGLVFGGGRNAVAETVEVFRENAEAGAARDLERQHRAITQMAAEFRPGTRSRFDIVMDGINRLPRPALALGTLGLFVSAMANPLWFAERMRGIALVPEPLWWLLGAVVSFYFGARHQAKTQSFQRDIALTLARVPETTESIARLQDMRGADGTDGAGVAAVAEDTEPPVSAPAPSDNPALDDWRRARVTG
ncbi:MAG: holin family protein [Marinibacterium sp.]